jgi:hypothetical protein
LGTGVAPLVAAARLVAEGKSVFLLNPDRDFLGEGSELALDPFAFVERPADSAARLAAGSPRAVAEALRPNFPGAIELCGQPGASRSAAGFRDPGAPHVRERARLWLHPGPSEMRSEGASSAWDWEELEGLYLQALDAGLHPSLLEGLAAIRKFPGVGVKVSQFHEAFRGMLVPRFADVDVERYASGLLEFVRERVGASRVLCGVSQIELIPEGVRFYWQGAFRTSRLRDGLLCFWTPRLSSWVLARSKAAEVEPRAPRGARVWEEWTLASRDPLDPSVVGSLGEWTVWAAVEGAHDPQARYHRLKALRPGPLVPLAVGAGAAPRFQEASQESFRALSRLCLDFLHWDYFTVQGLRARTLLDWGAVPGLAKPWRLGDELSRAFVLGGCDGPLAQVVATARSACSVFLEESP